MARSHGQNRNGQAPSAKNKQQKGSKPSGRENKNTQQGQGSKGGGGPGKGSTGKSGKQNQQQGGPRDNKNGRNQHQGGPKNRKGGQDRHQSGPKNENAKQSPDNQQGEGGQQNGQEDQKKRTPSWFNLADFPFNSRIHDDEEARDNLIEALRRRYWYNTLDWKRDADEDVIMADLGTGWPVWFAGVWYNPCLDAVVDKDAMIVEDEEL